MYPLICMKKIIILFLITTLLSCVSEKKPVQQTETKPAEPEPVIIIEPEPEPEPEPVLEPEPEEEEFEVSETIYKETFNEIEELIKTLNKIIVSRNFSKWKKHLSPDYIKVMSDPAVLLKYSEQPILKKYNIQLKSLKDYFEYVVVPSRSNVTVDEIKFLDENRLIAYMIRKEIKTIIYQLEKKNDTWVISTWESEDNGEQTDEN